MINVTPPVHRLHQLERCRQWPQRPGSRHDVGHARRADDADGYFAATLESRTARARRALRLGASQRSRRLTRYRERAEAAVARRGARHDGPVQRRHRGRAVVVGVAPPPHIVRRMPGAVVDTLAELRAVWPDLRDVAVLGLDLRSEPLDWRPRGRPSDAARLPPAGRRRPTSSPAAVSRCCRASTTSRSWRTAASCTPTTSSSSGLDVRDRGVVRVVVDRGARRGDPGGARRHDRRRGRALRLRPAGRRRDGRPRAPSRRRPSTGRLRRRAGR